MLILFFTFLVVAFVVRFHSEILLDLYLERIENACCERPGEFLEFDVNFWGISQAQYLAFLERLSKKNISVRHEPGSRVLFAGLD
jgi:hypothetical protein